MPNSETEHLVAMANDIAANLSFEPDAPARVADHIRRFWAPRMRGLLLEHAAAGAEGLSEVVLNAVVKLRG